MRDVLLSMWIWSSLLGQDDFFKIGNKGVQKGFGPHRQAHGHTIGKS
jgi:hypothetical protein